MAINGMSNRRATVITIPICLLFCIIIMSFFNNVTLILKVLCNSKLIKKSKITNGERKSNCIKNV